MRLLVLSLGFCLVAGCAGPKPDVTVFAAASAAGALGEIAAAYEEASGLTVRLNFGSSGRLARQIEAGAPADVFLSASPAWTDYLAEHGDGDASSARVPMRNRLVLVQARASGTAAAGALQPATALTGATGRVAMGDPGHVPAGRYAREALEAGGWFKRLAGEDRLLFARDARAALALVELGECEVGVVYASDARRSRAVQVVHAFPEASHTPIAYVMMATHRASPAARDFITYACGPQASAVLARHGFEAAAGGGGALK